MNRRFLNLIVEDLKTGVKSLHLIDPWKHLFYPSSAGKVEAADVHVAQPPENKKQGGAALIDTALKLPKPHLRFGLDPGVKPMHFFSALLKENCLLLAYSAHTPFLYDVDLNAQMFIPDMSFPKGPNCVSFSTPQPDPFYPLDTHCLYVLDLSPATSSFEVLNYFCRNHSSQPKFKPHYNSSFYWQDLPPPPPFQCDTMCSAIMVNGSTICISSTSVDKGVGGTYAFDMVTKVWSRVGDRVLPFYGKAEHVPELNLSFALSADSPRRLCALDCATMPPTLQHTFDYLDLPEKWSPCNRCHLVNLGSGRFGIVSLCENMKHRFAVFTGVEVKPGDNGDGPLRMIKHMSKRYSLGSHIINCVL